MNTPTPPWQLCDTATRTAIAACRHLNELREHDGISLETLAARSGISVMTVTRAMQAAGCNLAEFVALSTALGSEASFILSKSRETTPAPTNPSAGL